MVVTLLVGLAGAIGALLRYSISLLFPFAGTGFPTATLVANLLGTFILGLLMGYFSGNRRLSPRLEAMIYTGLIGSFTTFSTFSVETFLLMQQAAYVKAFAYIIISAAGGVYLTMFGYSLGKRPHREGGPAT